MRKGKEGAICRRRRSAVRAPRQVPGSRPRRGVGSRYDHLGIFCMIKEARPSAAKREKKKFRLSIWRKGQKAGAIAPFQRTNTFQQEEVPLRLGESNSAPFPVRERRMVVRGGKGVFFHSGAGEACADRRGLAQRRSSRNEKILPRAGIHLFVVGGEGNRFLFEGHKSRYNGVELRKGKGAKAGGGESPVGERRRGPQKKSIRMRNQSACESWRSAQERLKERGRGERKISLSAPHGSTERS